MVGGGLATVNFISPCQQASVVKQTKQQHITG